ncbi:hypothetical protein N7512_009648 [Penicillium capsulatum]|nr:hypothetical protein N7512_009648 [Penicillium capsulatum]
MAQSASEWVWQIYRMRPRSPRTKAIALTAIGLFIVVCLLSSPFSPDLWAKFPSHHPFPNQPEDAQVVLPQKSDLHVNDTLPNNLAKVNPQLHVLVPAQQGSLGVCRTLTSAMIAGYPPPTLIGYDHDKPGATEYERKVNRITRIRDYLRKNHTVKDHDLVLLVDAEDTYFQLPPHVLVKRFQDILRTNNQKLRQKYGMTEAGVMPDGTPKIIQKYSQRVVFSASKECYQNLRNDPGCISVPQSSLPPDVYGWETDTKTPKNRPRWLNPGAVIGQAADLGLIYDEVLRSLQQHKEKRIEHRALTQMFGRQEVVRELERRQTVNRAKDWFYNLLGLSDASNLTGVNIHLEAGHRYEYGIGVDYGSQLFFNQLFSINDVEWIRLNNITRATFLQRNHGVPRETRLLIPQDVASLHSPFNQTRFLKEHTTRPAYNATLDKLPSPREHSWYNLPLMANAHSFSVPVLVHLSADRKLHNSWWEQLWFFPWGRALLRKYVRSSQGFDAAQSSLLGGQEWWDMRGGRGGLWTDDENWITISEVCEGHERDLFDDGMGPWAKENGDPDEPVYNQWGNLVYGKEKVVDGLIVDGEI